MWVNMFRFNSQKGRHVKDLSHNFEDTLCGKEKNMHYQICSDGSWFVDHIFVVHISLFVVVS